MRNVVVDIEADGPIPGKYSMLSIGAVFLDDLDETFYVELQPISDNYVPEALAVSGLDRQKLYSLAVHPQLAMDTFNSWLNPGAGRLQFISDNAGFDWMFVCWYFHTYFGKNPFGFSPFSITSFYKGVEKDMAASFKHLRKTPHTHNALSDALGNAEALQAIRKMGIKNL